MGFFNKRIKKYELQIWNQRATRLGIAFNGAFTIQILEEVQCKLEVNPYFSNTHVGLVLSPPPEFVKPAFKENPQGILFYQHLNDYLMSEPTSLKAIDGTDCEVVAFNTNEEDALELLVRKSMMEFHLKEILTPDFLKHFGK
jgi:hypothetical protein